MDLYTFSLHSHSGLRWLVLFLGLIVTMKSAMGMFGKPKYAKIDNIFGASFVGLMHTQLLLGLVLYVFLSPVTALAFEDFGAAMKNTELRFWAVEHITIMLIAIVLAQIGRTKSKKATEARKKFRIQTIFFGLALLLMVAGIPWGRFID